MDRYIKCPTNLKYNDLLNVDWDVIELQPTANHEGLLEWYNSMSIELESAKWIGTPEFEEKYHSKEFKKRWWAANPIKYKDEPPFWWMMNWPIERYDPLPHSFLADKNLFPETDPNVYSDDLNPLLTRFKFGEFKNLYDQYGKYLNAARTTVFPKNSGVGLHIDMPYPNVIIRMHIQVNPNPKCEWQFGHTADRRYVMEPGKMYLVNTAVFHSVANFGDSDWVMIYGTPNRQDIDELLELK